MAITKFRFALLVSAGMCGPIVPASAAMAQVADPSPSPDAPGATQAADASDAAQSPAAAPGGAGSAIGDIVVTAERRIQSLQRTAASVSVRDGSSLQREGKFTLRQILEDVPSVTAIDFRAQSPSGSDAAGTNVTIRGISSNEGSGTVSSVPTTAVYVDGVFEGVGRDFDVDRVEVLRGPQGTLYGRSATAGVLSFHTRNPKLGGWSGDLNAEVGSYDLRHYTGALNIPVSDSVAIRVSGDQYARDGFYNGNGGHVNRTSGRAKLLIQPSDQLSLLFGVAVQDNVVNTGGAQGNFTPSTGVQYTTLLPVETSHNRFWQYWADIKLELGGVTINYLPALRTWKQNAVQSVIGPALLPLRQTVTTPKDRFHTQELRFSGKIGENLTWLGGAFYYDNDLSNTNDIRFASSGGLLANSSTDRRSRNLGFFADATYDLSSDWRVTGGVRWDHTKVQTDQVYTTNSAFICNTPLAPTLPDGSAVIPGCPAGPGGANAGLPEALVVTRIGGNTGKSTFRNFTYRARVEHDLTPRNLVYGTISSGFIPGDVQVGTGGDGRGGQIPVIRRYTAETLTAFELGSKNRLFDSALQLNGDVFYYRYGGFQSLVQPNPIDPSSQFVATIPARVWGAELEGVARLSSHDRVSVNYAYVGSRYKDRPAEVIATVSQDFITGIAPHTVNLNYWHTFDLGASSLVVSAFGRYTSAFDRGGISPTFVSQLASIGVDRDRVIRQNAQITANLTSTLTIGDGRFAITGYVRNLFDKRYINYTVLQSVLPTYVSSGGLSDPRTFGVIASVRF